MAAKKVIGISTCPGVPGFMVVTALLEDGSIFQKSVRLDNGEGAASGMNWQEVKLEGLPEKPQREGLTIARKP